MNIAIQQGLDELKKELEARGYNTFYIGENSAADAVIYNEKDKFPYYEVNSVSSGTMSSGGDNIGFGTLLINATNKSTDDIIGILHSRTYSPLF